MEMTPELASLFSAVEAARKTQSEQRPKIAAAKADVKAAEEVFDAADEAEGRAVEQIGKIVKPRKGDELFFETPPGTWWLVKKEGRKVEVRRVKSQTDKRALDAVE